MACCAPFAVPGAEAKELDEEPFGEDRDAGGGDGFEELLPIFQVAGPEELEEDPTGVGIL